MNGVIHLKGTKPETILIIDDLRENRQLLIFNLRPGNYAFLEADNGSDGVALARRQQPDLILLDVMMPQLSGFEVCRMLKQDPLTHTIPVVMITALREINDRIAGIEAGADGFLSRPYNRDELLARVRTLVQLRQTRQELEVEHNKLRLLYHISQIIGEHVEASAMLQAIVEATQVAFGAARGNLILINEAGDVTTWILSQTGSHEGLTLATARAVMRQGFGAWLVHHQQGALIADTGQDERWLHLGDPIHSARSAIGVPLLKGDQALGALVLTHTAAAYFQPQHLELLQTIANQAATAIQKLRYFEAMHEKRLKLEALLAQSSDVVVATDEDYRVTHFNRAAERLLGLEEQMVVGRLLAHIPELHFIAPLFRLAHHQSVAQEVAAPPARTLYSSISQVPGVGYLAVMQDVTELKQAEQQRLEVERQEKIRLRETFTRYVSPQLVENILANHHSILEQRELRQAVVLFADLRDFTSMLVNLPPDRSLGLLNTFFDQMTEIVYAYEGTIFDLIGDELEVGFNVPLLQPDAARRAVATAVAMQQRFRMLRHVWLQEVGLTLGLGIGIDLGEVLIGNVGARTHMNYAMVGEAVNTAHRLVELAEDGQILISEAVYAAAELAASAGTLGFTPLGTVKMKGIEVLRPIYRLQLPSEPVTLDEQRLMLSELSERLSWR